MAISGMDVDQVRQAGITMQTAAKNINDQILTTMKNLCDGLNWTGTDATNFQNEWPNIQTALQNAAKALDEHGQKAVQNATDQFNVSQK